MFREVQAELEWPPAFGKEMRQAGGGRQEVEDVHSLVGEKPVKGVGTDGEQPGEDGRTAVNDFCGGLWGKEPRCFSVATSGNRDGHTTPSSAVLMTNFLKSRPTGIFFF